MRVVSLVVLVVAVLAGCANGNGESFMSAQDVDRSDFEDWPLRPDGGRVVCHGTEVATFFHDGRHYALTAGAAEQGRPSVALLAEPGHERDVDELSDFGAQFCRG
jgi:hypothetical protein